MVYHICSISELSKIELSNLNQDDIVISEGYYSPSDGITLKYIYKKDSTKPHNGGLVINPNSSQDEAGRFHLLHNGECDFRYFGIFDATVEADVALAAMVEDKYVKKIHAYTDLRFTKRHKFQRSNIDIDFHSNNVYTNGIEPASHNDPFGAIMHFKGTLTDTRQRLELTNTLNEFYDIFEVENSDDFKLYEWWVVMVDNLSGREEKEIDKMLMVTEIIDKTHVRFNYKMGWEVEKGRFITYTKVLPVENVNISNMIFWGNYGGEEHGAQPLALEYAYNCNCFGINGHHTYWPVILRRHNTNFVTQKCSLTNPVEVVVGGTGYLTQQIHCLYGKVRDCVASNSRHLNDFTGSAFSMVENCHGDGDFHGAFVTHGQFEHDLTYVGNSGLISFANSGFTWGESAKRISVKRHSACWFIAHAKVTDLTIEDVQIIKTEKYPQCGTMLINADGVQIRGCSADKLIFTQRSARSKRPCVVQDSYFTDGIEITSDGEKKVTSKITITNTQRKDGEC